nr:hypothetical protein [Tanacetum cinerariifolium]
MGDTPVKTHQSSNDNQSSTLRPQKKQKPRRKQRNKAEVSPDESEDEDNVPTPSSDPLPSGDDSYTLHELMVFCTSLQEQVFDLQEAKDAQSKEISALKKKVSTLLKWRKSRSGGLRRLMEEIDQDDEIALDADTQGSKTNDEMFGDDDLIGEEVVTTVADKVSVAPTTDVTKYEITMAQALAALKSVKPTIPAAATKVTTVVQNPRAKVIVIHEQKKSHIPTISSLKDKGKAKMIEPEATRLSRAQQDEEANISWDNTQAMIEADSLLAERLQAREREEFSEEQKERLEMRKINRFIAMDSEAQKSSGKEAPKSSTKRTAESLEYEISKEKRADGNSQVYQTFEKMFKNFNREDVEVLWAIVKDIFKKEKPVDDMDNLLFRTLKTMFEHNVEDVIWTYQQGLAKVKNWKLYESCGVYCITMQSIIYYLLIEKVYPLTRNTLHQLWNDVRLQVDHDVEMAYDLLRLIRKQLMKSYTPQ